MTTDRLPGPSAQPDFEAYRLEPADLHLTEDQEIAILEILWTMMGFFARTGFEVDVCGLIFQEFNEASARASADAKLTASPNKEMPSNGRKDGGHA